MKLNEGNFAWHKECVAMHENGKHLTNWWTIWSWNSNEFKHETNLAANQIVSCRGAERNWFQADGRAYYLPLLMPGLHLQILFAAIYRKMKFYKAPDFQIPVLVCETSFLRLLWDFQQIVLFKAPRETWDYSYWAINAFESNSNSSEAEYEFQTIAKRNSFPYPRKFPQISSKFQNVNGCIRTEFYEWRRFQ